MRAVKECKVRVSVEQGGAQVGCTGRHRREYWQMKSGWGLGGISISVSNSVRCVRVGV